MPTLDRELLWDRRNWGRAGEVAESVPVPTGYRRHVVPLSVRQRAREWFRGARLKPKVWIVYDSKEKQLIEEWVGRLSGARRPKAAQSIQAPAGVEEVIASSRWVLNLKQDWDEQGSLPYAESTWRRACDFLIRQANFARDTFHRELPAPKILPGPNASIDLHWKVSRFELLVNVPSDPTKTATFYGDDYGDLRIKGDLNTSEAILGLVVWLLN